jgi:hypothetical protein
VDGVSVRLALASAILFGFVAVSALRLLAGLAAASRLINARIQPRLEELNKHGPSIGADASPTGASVLTDDGDDPRRKTDDEGGRGDHDLAGRLHHRAQ